MRFRCGITPAEPASAPRAAARVPDQAWILGELIAYLDNDASGAAGFDDMGDKWVSVRKAGHNGTLRQDDAEARAVAERWEQFTQYLCLGLSQDLGGSVTSPRPSAQAPTARVDELAKVLASDGALDAVIVADVPEAPQPDPPPFVAADEREAGEGSNPVQDE